MKERYCDFCKKKIDTIPETKASYEYPYPGPENGVYKFSVEVKVHLCTGMDICCSCAEKAVEMALYDEETAKRLVKRIINPPCYYV